MTSIDAPADEAAEAADGISPIDIALAAMQGLLASGRYNDNPAAGAVIAWQCVWGFQEGMRQWAAIAATEARLNQDG